MDWTGSRCGVGWTGEKSLEGKGSDTQLGSTGAELLEVDEVDI